ncbi:uncharacterized protein MELLADRAFT_70157 [Melampsora larici-populina 98AG31]|uniref:Uncharacterized protein n=1 Tax=Melampsora larici-populina (strain 98AG31 / pathotype 3-4-7) TaxID=747676 RepID=F4SDU4_MELLP|nr:uncharacterized protein MELLADRAFT_70157 [Melampsora larici-populina 98AG31]EGF97182.1 hypothetical protein MELLADRAFT_70157 [Melampsora larici-populina 98AG31]
MIQAIKSAEEKKKLQEMKELEQAELRKRRAESRLGTERTIEPMTQSTSMNQAEPGPSIEMSLEMKKEATERNEDKREKAEEARELEDGGHETQVPGIQEEEGSEGSEEEVEVTVEKRKKVKGKARRKSLSVSSLDEGRERGGKKDLRSLLETDHCK